MKVAVIGSGVAGLVAGASLAQAGHQVTIFEQYHRPGGVTYTLERHGFKWDLGQMLVMGLGKGEPSGDVLDALGILGRLQVKKDDRRYVFPDFDLAKPTDYSDPRWRMERLKEIFPKESRGLDRYWRDLLRFTRLMTRARQLDKTAGLGTLATQARLYLSLVPFLSRMSWSARRLMDNFFHDEKLKCVFISILADFFTPPSLFPGLGVFSLNPETSFDARVPPELAPGAVELNHYSILGGISTLVDALVARIEEFGGELCISRPVVKIEIDAGRVTGVTDQGGNFTPADVVVASGTAKETFFNLVGEDQLPLEFVQKVKNLALMDSVFMVHLGLDVDPAPSLRSSVVYYYGTYDIESGINEAKQGIYHEGKAGFVVHVPTTHSPQMAPPGKHAMTIYTICPDRLSEGSWEERRQEYADKLVAYAEEHIPGLRQHTQVRVILTPEDFRTMTLCDHHSFGGLRPEQKGQRIPHQTPIAGLWFVGAQSESGGGVNGVIPAAYKTALRITAHP